MTILGLGLRKQRFLKVYKNKLIDMATDRCQLNCQKLTLFLKLDMKGETWFN